MKRITSRALTATLLITCAYGAWADSTSPLPPDARLVTASGAPAPTLETFAIATAQDLIVTFTDLQVPAALTSATVVVTQGNTLVGSATLAAPATSATVPIPAAGGDFKLWVFGTPDSSANVGTFSVCVAPNGSPSACIQSASLAGNITAGSAANPTVSTLNQTLTVTTGGSYSFNFTDFQFPTALATAPQLALFQGSNAVQLSIAAGSAINLSPGTYTLLSIAQADATAQAGLYGLTVSAAGATPLLDVTTPVGKLSVTDTFDNTAAQAVTLKVTDFGFPGALASAAALLSSGGTAVAHATATSGAVTQNAPAGSLNVWIYAAAGGTSGTYEADVTAAGAPLYTTAGGANLAGSGTFAYGFVSPSVTSGNYQATVADLKFPSALAGLSFEVAQGGSVLDTSKSGGTIAVTVAANPVVFLVAAQPPTSTSANGLFDVSLQASGSASTTYLFDQTQSVSSATALFDAQSITTSVNASFSASLTDLKVPAAFANLAMVVSQGPTVFGQIFGTGTFSFNATPGVYQLTFVANTDSQQQVGLYGTSVAYTPPTITSFAASASSVAVNSSVTLNWATANATSCTGSGGGWNGSTNSGSVSLVLSATTTYSLSCTGPGGTVNQSVTVAGTTASSSGGGGGSLSLAQLAALAALFAVMKNSSRGHLRRRLDL